MPAEVKHTSLDQEIHVLTLRNNTCANRSELKTLSEFLQKTPHWLHLLDHLNEISDTYFLLQLYRISTFSVLPF